MITARKIALASIALIAAIPRASRWAARKMAPGAHPAPRQHPGILRAPRVAALAAIAVLVAAASLVSFAESYRGLYDWAREHGLSGIWAAVWPLQIDTFIAVGELALFVALVDAWKRRSRIAAWTVTLAGLIVSVGGNVGHVHGHQLADRVTAAVPPLAAAAALAVGLGVLKRVVEHHHQAAGTAEPDVPAKPDVPAPDALPAAVPTDAQSAALIALRATLAAGNPLSGRQLESRFGLSRAEVAKVREMASAEMNGHAPETTSSEDN
jgi:hypothetical protein